MGFDVFAFKKAKIRRLLGRFSKMWASQKNRSAFPSLIECPPGPNILVLSPHPDDDILGCGGTLAKHKIAGDTITSVTLTDGSFGDPTIPDKSVLVQKRERESQTAAKIIGISRCVFLREQDQKLTVTDSINQKVRRLLDETRPDLVYLPFFLDNHPDHIAANEIFYRVILNKRERFKCCFYETWAPLFPNILVDISEQMDLKVKAVEAFETQLKHFDYVRICKGLNAYRSMLFRGESAYAEAFYLISTEDYVSLFKKVWGDS